MNASCGCSDDELEIVTLSAAESVDHRSPAIGPRTSPTGSVEDLD